MENTNEVYLWLCKLNLQEFWPNFEQNSITSFASFEDLEKKADLSEGLKISSFGACQRLWKAIQKVKEPRLMPASSSAVDTTTSTLPSKQSHLIKGEHLLNWKDSFYWPRGVTASLKLKRIYVSGAVDNTIVVFTSERKYLFEFNKCGMNNKNLNSPAGMAINEEKDILYVCDRGNHRIVLFDLEGNWKYSFGRKVQIISDLSTEDYSGRPKKTEFKVNGGHGQFYEPSYISISRDHKLFITDRSNNRVQVFSFDGTYEDEFGNIGEYETRLRWPHGIKLSKHTDKAYICDNLHHRIGVYRQDGTYLYSFGGEGKEKGKLRKPNGIELDGNDNVYVCDSGNKRIQVFNSKGKVIKCFGEKGKKEGQFVRPDAMYLDEERGILYVCDVGTSLLHDITQIQMWK